MKNKLIIFGTGKISEVVSNYFELDENHEICGYVVDDKYKKDDNFLGKPLVSESEVMGLYPPKKFKCFIAIGYQNNNSLRSDKFDLYKKMGYNFTSYIPSNLKINFEFGENNFIMDSAIIQPKVSIGNNVFVWGGSMVGHHSKIKDNCWITGGSLIGGSAVIEKFTFLGMGSTIGHEITIGCNSFIGASTLVTKDTPNDSVIIEPDSKKIRLTTDQFLKISSLK